MRSPLQDFTLRVLIAVAAALALALVAWLAWRAADILLLVFAGALLAIFLRGLANEVARRLPWLAFAAFPFAVLALLGVVGGVGALLAPRVSAQLAVLVRALPSAVGSLAQELGSYSWSRNLLEQARAWLLGAGVLGNVFGTLSLTFTVLADALFVLFVALFLGADPRRYREGLVRLLPPATRGRAREVLFEVVLTLRGWLLGQLVAMLVIGTLTGLGLWWLKVPLPLTLGVLSGLLEFIPFAGPILSAVPAALLAFAQEPVRALYVLALFLAVNQIEGSVLQPLIQARAVSLPPLLTLTATLIAAALFGFLGVLVATPLTATALVLVKMLYLEGGYGDEVSLPGRRRRR